MRISEVRSVQPAVSSNIAFGSPMLMAEVLSGAINVFGVRMHDYKFDSKMASKWSVIGYCRAFLFNLFFGFLVVLGIALFCFHDAIRQMIVMFILGQL